MVIVIELTDKPEITTRIDKSVYLEHQKVVLEWILVTNKQVVT